MYLKKSCYASPSGLGLEDVFILQINVKFAWKRSQIILAERAVDVTVRQWNFQCYAGLSLELINL